MTPAELAVLFRLLNAMLTAGINIDAAIDRFKAATANGPMTLDQIDELAEQFTRNLERL
jgi:hypothetical protein